MAFLSLVMKKISSTWHKTPRKYERLRINSKNKYMVYIAAEYEILL